MPIKAIYDEKPTEAVTIEPDEFIETDDGKWMAPVESVGNVKLENVGELRSALQKSKANLETARKQLKRFGDITPEKIEELRALAEADGQDPADIEEKVKAMSEQRIKQFQDKAKRDAEAADTKYRDLETSWLRGESDRQLLDAMAAIGAPRELLPIFQAGIRPEIVEQDGQRSVAIRVLGEGGAPRLSEKAGTSEDMGVAEFVATYKEHPKFSRLFEGSGSSGSGSGSPGQSSPSTRNGVLRIPRGDQEAINANVDKIATGEAVVVD